MRRDRAFALNKFMCGTGGVHFNQPRPVSNGVFGTKKSKSVVTIVTLDHEQKPGTW